MSIPRPPTAEPELFTAVNSCEAAVAAEIAEMGSGVRPGLAAVCLAMAKVLDNNRAVSSQGAAAGQLVNALGQLRKHSKAAKPTLTSVRQMTKPADA